MKSLLKVLILFISISLPGLGLCQDRLKTPNSEVEDVIKYLKGEDKNGKKYVAQIDEPYIRFLSSYAVKDPKDRLSLALTSSFVLHSLVGPAKDLDNNNAGAFYPLAKVSHKEGSKDPLDGEIVELQRVPFSDTLWWLDLRDYNFTPEAWEVASGVDGYFAVPIVQEQNNGAMRLIAGNAILRMDWFITQVTDTARQRDIEHNFDLYTTFLFAQVTAPKNLKDWQKLFSIDVDKTREIGNEYGTLVTESKTVARHNRMLFGYNTELGYMYDTYDVKNQDGQRDYYSAFFKNPKPGTPPPVSDAGETFATNILGLQVYALRDGKGNLIQFGDPTVVRNLTDIHNDIRVKVAHSCMDCHATGPLPAENSLVEYLRGDTEIYLYKKEDKNRVKRAFLDGKFDKSIEFNRERFAYAINKCNGLTPELNSQLYLKAVKDYTRDVDIERAAFECGVTQQEFKEKMLKGNFGGRLKNLVENGKTIPIDIWETRGKDGIPGQFQQAMILINGLTEIKQEKEIVIQKEVKNKIVCMTNVQVDLVVGNQKLGSIPKDTELEILEEEKGFCRVIFNDKTGWIPLTKVTKK